VLRLPRLRLPPQSTPLRVPGPSAPAGHLLSALWARVRDAGGSARAFLLALCRGGARGRETTTHPCIHVRGAREGLERTTRRFLASPDDVATAVEAGRPLDAPGLRGGVGDAGLTPARASALLVSPGMSVAIGTHRPVRLSRHGQPADVCHRGQQTTQETALGGLRGLGGFRRFGHRVSSHTTGPSSLRRAEPWSSARPLAVPATRSARGPCRSCSRICPSSQVLASRRRRPASRRHVLNGHGWEQASAPRLTRPDEASHYAISPYPPGL